MKVTLFLCIFCLVLVIYNRHNSTQEKVEQLNNILREKEIDLSYKQGRLNGYIEGFDIGFSIGRYTNEPKPDLKSFVQKLPEKE